MSVAFSLRQMGMDLVIMANFSRVGVTEQCKRNLGDSKEPRILEIALSLRGID